MVDLRSFLNMVDNDTLILLQGKGFLMPVPVKLHDLTNNGIETGHLSMSIVTSVKPAEFYNNLMLIVNIAQIYEVEKKIDSKNFCELQDGNIF